MWNRLRQSKKYSSKYISMISFFYYPYVKEIYKRVIYEIIQIADDTKLLSNGRRKSHCTESLKKTSLVFWTVFINIPLESTRKNFFGNVSWKQDILQDADQFESEAEELKCLGVLLDI